MLLAGRLRRCDRRVARLQIGHARHPRPDGRGVPRGRVPAVSGTRIPRLERVPPVALATPLLLWAFLYMEEDRSVHAAVFLVLAAACKETVPLVIAFLGAYFAFRSARRRRSSSPSPPSVARRRRVGRHPALQWRPERLHLPLRGLRQRCGRGGEERAPCTPDRPPRTCSRSPTCATCGAAVASGVHVTAAALTLLIALPEYGLSVSATVFQRRIEFHYTALEIPFLFAAAIQVSRGCRAGWAAASARARS